MKVLAVLMVLLALVIGVIPQLTDCESHGLTLTLANGRQVSMKCHWTARGEIAVAAPLLFVGVMSGFSRRRETKRNLAIMGMVLGVAAILLPTVLIGVCANPEMLCNSVMRPTLILLGTAVAAVSLVMLVNSLRTEEIGA